jgi:DNA-binding transcriptional ArsR family regulator
MSDDRTDEQREVSAMRATAHPVRLQILSLLTGAELSAAEIARELDLTHANASYHLRTLADAGLVVEAGEEKIRGGVAKRYRHPWEQADMRGKRPSPEDVAQQVHAMASELVRRFGSREPMTPSWLTDAEMWVAPDVWEQVLSLVEQASRLVHAEAKPPRTPGTVHVNLTAAAFEMAEPARPTEEKP